jgi:glycyl-tRNA synthetase beta chain
MMAELLLEILSEEIPARMQARAADDLKRLVCEGLNKAGLEFSAAEAHVTPRRLILMVDGLPTATPDVNDVRKGPKVGAPEQALAGFMKANGFSSIDEAEIRELPKGEFYFAVVEKKGSDTSEVLAEIIPTALQNLPWPKSMRWASHNQRWVRPIHSMVCMFDGAGVVFEFGPRTAGTETVGHRFLSPDVITVRDFADYKEKLRAAKVMIDRGERRELILAQATKLAESEGLVLKDDKGLLDEVSGLVEWPVILMGTIDEEFMDVPAEVLITSMKKHQKYFSCLDKDGNLANRFIVVANTETVDGGKEVVAGNERVLRARLSDAKFFWDQDRKTTLASKAPLLKDRVFHAKLGTLEDKVARVMTLGGEISEHVGGADVDQVSRAAELAKADLSTGMVGEFPDLQGVIGRYYALNDGESPDVADAIAEHYSPQGPGDVCPSEPTSICVALADKIDTLTGFWSIDEKPTGSKDPYALRRAALGAIRLILENDLKNLSLRPIFVDAFDRYNASSELADDLLSFFADRLKVHLKEQGVKHDHIDAVFGLGDEDDLVRLLARVEALSAFLGSEDGENLLIAYRRAANILKIEEKKDGRSYADAPDASRFEQDEEKALFAGLESEAGTISNAINEERFSDAMQALAKLRGPVDAFFDAVTVNADEADIRENRLKLLSMIRSALDGVADFSKIEG